MTDKNLADPVHGPFIRGLDYSHTTLFVDEAAQRQVTIDMINGVLLKNQPATEALAVAAPREQRIIDARKIK
jgi:multiple sugar transport system substrate-binding protein